MIARTGEFSVIFISIIVSSSTDTVNDTSSIAVAITRKMFVVVKALEAIYLCIHRESNGHTTVAVIRRRVVIVIAIVSLTVFSQLFVNEINIWATTVSVLFSVLFESPLEMSQQKQAHE